MTEISKYLYTKKKKFFTVFYKGIKFTNEESLLNFQRKEKLDNILDDKELNDDFEPVIKIEIIPEYDYPK